MTIDYGEDFAGGSDVDANLTIVGGNVALLHAIARRLMTPNGAYPFDEEYGTDIRAFVGATAKTDLVAMLIETEVAKEERVRAVTATVTRERLTAHSSERLRVELSVVGARGPFEATLLASELSVEILDEIAAP